MARITYTQDTAFTTELGRGVELTDGRKLFVPNDGRPAILWDCGLWRDLDERRPDHADAARRFSKAHGIAREDA